MTRKLTFLILALFALISGPGWGQTSETVTLSYGWENADDATLWDITESITKTESQGNTGSFAGKINTNHTYVQFKNKVKVTSFSFAFKRTSNNSNYNVYIETSTDGTNWTAAETYAMGSFSNGSYSTKTKTFDGTTEYYVRFHCYNTTAVRYVDDVTIEYSTSDTPTAGLVSLAVSGTPTKTEYETGEEFDPAGLVVTGTYDDASTETITSGITWDVTPNPLTAGTTSVRVTATVDDITSPVYTVNGLTVNEHIVTPGTYQLGTDWNALFGTDYSGSFNPSANSLNLNGTSNDITLNVTNGTSTNGYIKTGDFRWYNGYTLTFTVPQGYVITNITFTKGGKNPENLTTETGSFNYNSQTYESTWNGSSQSITFSATGTGGVSTIQVTYAMPSSVATPTFSPAPTGTYFETQNVEITCSTGGAAIRYTIDGTTPTNESTEYTAAITVSETTTIKAIAILGEESSSIATATYNFGPVYTSLAELVAAGAPTEDGVVVKVTLSNEVITDFYTSSTSGNRNGVYLTVDEQEIEIYCQNVPTEWVVGGKLSGILTCPWKLYDGTTWELCPENWNGLTYTAPQSYDITLNPTTGGTISADKETAAAGETVTLSYELATGYTFGEWDVRDSQGATVTVSTDDTFTMPASNVSVSATFNAVPTYTISFTTNGVAETEATIIVNQGDAIGTLPEPTAAYIPNGYTFMGWSANEVTLTNDEPDYVTAETVPEDNMTLKAVFAIAEGSATEYIMTQRDNISEGTYLIGALCSTTQTNDFYFATGELTTGSNADMYVTENATNIEEVSGIRRIDAIPNDAAEFALIGNSTDGYTIKVGTGDNNYLGYTSTSNRKLAIGSDYSTYRWEPVEKGTIYASYSAALSSKSETYYIVENSTNSSNPIRSYGELSNGRGLYFFKKVSSASYSNFCTTVNPISGNLADATTVANTAYYISEAATVEGEVTINGVLGNADASLLIINDGAQLIHHNAGVVATVQKNITGYTNAQVNDGYYLIANPTERVPNDEYDVLDGATSGFDLYTFDPTEESEWRNKVGTVSRIPFERTVGYLFAVPSGRTMSFRGSILPASSMVINLDYYDGEDSGREFPGFNLIGNPFTCNAYVNKPALRLDDTGSEFIAVVGAINPCEGFFVEARSNDRTVTISTEEPATAQSSLSLTVNQNRGNVIDRAIVNFNGNNDLHKFMMNPAHTNIRLAKNGEEFAALSSDAEGEIPVSFKAEKNGSYTITVNTENVEAQYLHLIDNMTGMDTDLLSTPSYTFNASTRDYAYRFKLVFSMTGVEESQDNANSFAYISNGNLVIDNIEGEATMQIVDMLGRVISTETVSGSYNKALNLKAGLYIINLNGMTQKIVVK